MARSCVPVAMLFAILVGAADRAALAQGQSLAPGSATVSSTDGIRAPCAPAASSSVMILSPTAAAESGRIVPISSATISDLDEPQSPSDVPGLSPPVFKTSTADANTSNPIGLGTAGQGAVGQGP